MGQKEKFRVGRAETPWDERSLELGERREFGTKGVEWESGDNVGRKELEWESGNTVG